MQTYYVKEFTRGHWHILREGSGVPVHDDSPNGDDKPIVFTDHDKVLEAVDALNTAQEETLE